jgi:chromosome segregation ATPase
MKMLLRKLFKNSTPTVSQVDGEIQKVRDEIGTLTARQTAIIDELATDDSKADALTQEHANIGLRLDALDKRASLLTQERQQATMREFGAAIEAMLKPIADEMSELKEVKPKADEAARQYNELARQEQRLRSRLIVAQGTLTDEVNQLADKLGIDRRAVSAAIATAKSKYPLADESVAPSAGHARMAAKIYSTEPDGQS